MPCHGALYSCDDVKVEVLAHWLGHLRAGGGEHAGQGKNSETNPTVVFLVFSFRVFFFKKRSARFATFNSCLLETLTQVTPMPSLRRVLNRGVTSWHMQVPLMSLLRAVLGVNRQPSFTRHSGRVIAGFGST